MTDVARELARVFDAPTGSEFAIGFVLTQPPEAVHEQLRRSSIQVVRLAESFELKAEVEETLEPAQSQTTIRSESEITVENTIMQQLEPTLNTLDQTIRKEHEFETLPNSQETDKQNVPDVEKQSSEPQVTLDINNEEVVREIEGLKQLLVEGKDAETEKPDVWRSHREIEEVVSEPRIVVRPFVSASSKKNWLRQVVQGVTVFVETELDADSLASLSPIKPFEERMKKIVEIMGGNPKTVNICVANPTTDGDRREGQLFFNVLRNDTPLR